MKHYEKANLNCIKGYFGKIQNQIDLAIKDITWYTNEKEVQHIKELRKARKANKKLKKQIGYLKKVHREFKDSLGFNMQRKVKVNVNRDINSGEFITSTDINTKVYTKNGMTDLNEQDFELVKNNADNKFLQYLKDVDISIIGLDIDQRLVSFLNSVPMEKFQFLKDKREAYFKQELFNFKKNKSNNNVVKAGDAILTSHGVMGIVLDTENKGQYVSVLLDSLHEPINEIIHPLIAKQEIVIGKEAFQIIRNEADRRFLDWIENQQIQVLGLKEVDLLTFLDNLDKKDQRFFQALIDQREYFLKQEIIDIQNKWIREDKPNNNNVYIYVPKYEINQESKSEFEVKLQELYRRENPYIKIQGL